LGKLRAIDNEKDKYVLYDNGESYDSKRLAFDLSNLRRELGVFLFRYELCNVGNIRKMKVIIPQLLAKKINPDGSIDTVKPRSQSPDKQTENNADEGNYIFINEDYRPKYEHETMLKIHEKMLRKFPQMDFDSQKKAVMSDRFRTFVDNPPSWNPKHNSYVYNFKGRVSEASIKNFQLIPNGYKKEPPPEN